MNKVKETKNSENRFSRLQDMAKDVIEVAESLGKTVKEQHNSNNYKEKRKMKMNVQMKTMCTMQIPLI